MPKLSGGSGSHVHCSAQHCAKNMPSGSDSVLIRPSPQLISQPLFSVGTFGSASQALSSMLQIWPSAQPPPQGSSSMQRLLNKRYVEGQPPVSLGIGNEHTFESATNSGRLKQNWPPVQPESSVHLC